MLGFASAHMLSTVNRINLNITENNITIPILDNWKWMAGNGSIYVATSDNSTDVIVSSDGINWTTYSTGAVSNLGPIQLVGSYFVSISAGQSMWSNNGITWTRYVSNLPSTPPSYAYGTLFCTGGYWSNDSITWTATTGAVNGNSIATDGSQFVLAQGTGGAYHSNDGKTFTQITTIGITEPIQVACTGKLWTVMNNSSSGYNGSYSFNGINWFNFTFDPYFTDQWDSIASNGNVIIAISNHGYVVVTDNGPDWTIYYEPTIIGDQWLAFSAKVPPSYPAFSPFTAINFSTKLTSLVITM